MPMPRRWRGRSRVRELYALRPDRMRVVPGADGWPEAYDYSAGGRTVRFAAGRARPLRADPAYELFHPLNDHYGLSPMEAAATAVDTHNAAASWNKALLDNSARPSGALVYAAAGAADRGAVRTLEEELEQTSRAR